LVAVLRDNPDFSCVADYAGWKQLRAVAAVHGCQALVAHAVRSAVDAQSRAECDQILAKAWARHDAGVRRLDFICGVLADAGIETIVLKGVALARRHYNPPFLRKASFDIDLAVRDREIEAAAAALAAHGYGATQSLKEARHCSHHLNLVHPEWPEVELHFRLSNSTLGMPVEPFFGRTMSYSLPTGRSIQVLNAQDELLHLLLHFASGRFGSFFHLYELRKLWRAAPAEVQRAVIEAAVAEHFAWAVWLADLSFQEWWGERLIPEGMRIPPTWQQARLTPALLHELEFVAGLGRDLTPADRVRSRKLDLYLADSGFDAFRFVAVRQFWRRLHHAGDLLFGARRPGRVTNQPAD
jgi:hypothetical protein